MRPAALVVYSRGVVFALPHGDKSLFVSLVVSFNSRYLGPSDAVQGLTYGFFLYS